MSLPEPEDVTPLEGWYWSETGECYRKPHTKWEITRCSPSPDNIEGWGTDLTWGVCLHRFGTMISFFETPELAMAACDEGRAFESPALTSHLRLMKQIRSILYD